MKNYDQSQTSLNLVFETVEKYEVKKPNPFTVSERVKRALFKMGYSHIFNYPDYNDFKKLADGLSGAEKVQFISELFVENTSEESDLNEYVN